LLLHILAYSNDATLVADTLQVALIESGQTVILEPEERYRFGVAGFSDASNPKNAIDLVWQAFPMLVRVLDSRLLKPAHPRLTLCTNKTSCGEILRKQKVQGRE
jgi:hypothetical protein